MHLFYSPDIETNPVLDEAESKHLLRVLRKQVGDRLWATDGKGNLFVCEIADAQSKHCGLKIIEKRPEKPRGPKLEVAIAPTKQNERLEWFVEKAVETGVDKITPMLCVHSERPKVNKERLQKRAISAMKQSLKCSLVEIGELTKLQHIVSRAAQPQRFIAYIDDAADYSTLAETMSAAQDAIVLIGPEGDFSQQEVRLAIEHGFVPVSLGDSRLRTETAGLAACFTFEILKQLQP